MKQMKTAFVLGAGRGERLKPLTDACPKPLLPVKGKPLITFALDHLLTVEVERFIINTHHRAERYAEVFPDGSWRGRPIVFRHEPVLLNTGGGLKNIADLIDKEEHLWVYNGDVISNLPLKKLWEAHIEGGHEVTLALRTEGRNLNVGVDNEGRICDFRFALRARCANYYQFTGIYVVRKAFLNHLPAGVPVDIVDIFLELVRKEPGVIGGVLIDDGTWLDVGDPETYGRLNL